MTEVLVLNQHLQSLDPVQFKNSYQLKQLFILTSFTCLRFHKISWTVVTVVTAVVILDIWNKYLSGIIIVDGVNDFKYLLF